ncbi:elongation factor 1-delta-like [Daphnia pulex]|uniref:elongation factor 1-delta-like n=1 Tax=Daphnia pulex TaxID=6669 RepID=UPI001EDD6932|nr:elongation factor 1-delta-like [Daphnia pulex]XP_046639344.1 elongation factor 1-delta-like [Daphnia pulicaria]
MVNSAVNEALSRETVWYEKFRYEDAERQFQEILAKGSTGPASCSVVAEIMKARDQIKSSLAAVEDLPSSGSAIPSNVTSRLQQLEQENKDLKKVTDDLRSLVLSLESRVKSLESSKPGAAVQAPKPSAPQPAPPAKAAAKPDDDDDDDVDLFGSDEEDEDAERIKQERVAAYAAKKSTKPALIAKSNIILDVKPWDDETDMAEMERRVREITSDGLLWGTSKLVPLAYGIKKLQISTVVEDDKVSVDWLTETIQEIEDLVQSVDIAAFNKI